MPIDPNKQWTEDECTALVAEIANRFGAPIPDVVIRNRKQAGTYDLRWKYDTGEITSRKIFLAKHLWTGEYVVPSGLWKGDIVPVHEPSATRRLMTVLHECAHMVHHFTLGKDIQAFVRAKPHGLAFQKLERQLCREFGWSPVYLRTPGYAEHYICLNDGSKFEFYTKED